jgi:glucan phosphorylase
VGSPCQSWVTDTPACPPPHPTHSWITDTYELSKLKAYAEDAAFQEKWRAVKLEKKKKLAAYIKETFGDDVPLNALFDIQVRVSSMCSFCSL